MEEKNLVAVIMGSQSDWETMQHTQNTLDQLNIPGYAQVISAHRTPQLLYEFARKARDEGIEVIIAGAGGAAHLPGMIASMSSLPVLGVPIQSKTLSGMDSLLSIVQMPAGIPVNTLAIGKAGAINAALSAASILSIKHPDILKSLDAFRQNQTNSVLENTTPGASK